MKNITTPPPAPAQSVATSQGTPATPGKGYDTPAEKQQVYVPAAVWQGHPAAGGGGPTVSAEEALELGAIPGTIDLIDGTAKWPQRFFAPAPAQTAHTPGPWSTEGQGGYERERTDGSPRRSLNVGTRDGSTVAEVCVPMGGSWDNPTAAANARLIAAAPELLAALAMFLDRIDRNNVPVPSYFAHAVDTARAAIAKATKEGK